MQFISFNPFRTIGIPNINYVKPENMFTEANRIKAANWVLFPEYWQVNPLVYGWRKRIFPSINSYHLGHDKIEMTRLFQAIAPVNIPQTLILKNEPGVINRILDVFSYPFIAKVVRSSEGRGVSLITDKTSLNQYLSENEVLYLQEYLPIDRDLRVVFVGNKVFSAYWRIAQDGNFKNNLAQGGQLSYDNIPAEALELVTKIAIQAGINHAGFDLAVVGNHYYIIEFNVFFGNQGLKGKTKELNTYLYQYLLNFEPDNSDNPTIKAV